MNCVKGRKGLLVVEMSQLLCYNKFNQFSLINYVDRRGFFMSFSFAIVGIIISIITLLVVVGNSAKSCA